MQVPVSKELVDKIREHCDSEKNADIDPFYIRVYFTGDDAENEGYRSRINVELSGSMFSPGEVVNIWFG